MDSIHLELPEPPSQNTMWRKWRNRMVLSEAGRAYKQAVWLSVLRYFKDNTIVLPRKATVLFPSGNLAVTWRWYRSSKRGDLDNRAKVLLDALQGTVYRNDNQIVELHAYRIDGDFAGRVTVDISAIPEGQHFAPGEHYVIEGYSEITGPIRTPPPDAGFMI